MKTYVLAEAVTVEVWYAGERCAFAGGPGNVKPKNEQQERALEHLLTTRPDLVKVSSSRKAED
jgi:hypothetical protein